MTWYADLSPCTYFPVQTPLTAIGWLDPAHAYSQGQVDEPTILTLFHLLENPWQPVVLMGRHSCAWCYVSGGPSAITYAPRGPSSVMNLTVSIGCTNLFIPGDGVVYVAPSLILHYIDAHHYLPPAAFLAAVHTCPPMGSSDYLNALRANRRRLLPVDRA
jgi:hypothetical protein